MTPDEYAVAIVLSVYILCIMWYGKTFCIGKYGTIEYIVANGD
jgi:hypothetical protein